MKRNSYDPDELVDRGIQQIQNETLDPRRVEESADRLWASVSAQAGDVEAPTRSAGDHGETRVPPVGAAPHGRIEGCAGFRALVPESVAGRLDGAQKLLFDDHVRECVVCRRALLAARGGVCTGGLCGLSGAQEGTLAGSRRKS